MRRSQSAAPRNTAKARANKALGVYECVNVRSLVPVLQRQVAEQLESMLKLSGAGKGRLHVSSRSGMLRKLCFGWSG